MSSKSHAQTAVAVALPHRLMIAALGGMIGLFLIYGVGFAQPQTIHNAAHDARHAFAFPCH